MPFEIDQGGTSGVMSNISKSKSNTSSLPHVMNNFDDLDAAAKLYFDKLSELVDSYESENDDEAYLGDKSNRYEEQRLE